MSDLKEVTDLCEVLLLFFFSNMHPRPVAGSPCHGVVVGLGARRGVSSAGRRAEEHGGSSELPLSDGSGAVSGESEL